MASLTQWTWVWASSGWWWRTGQPGMLQSMGSQMVRHDWETEQQHGSLCTSILATEKKNSPPEQGFPHAAAATVSRLVKGTAHWALLEKDWGLALVTAAAMDRSFSWAVCDVQFQDEVRVTTDTVDWVSVLGFFDLQRKNCLIKNIEHNFLLMWPHWILIRKTSLNGEAQH